MTIKLSATNLGNGRVRLSWTIDPAPTEHLLVDGKIVNDAETSTTIVFLEAQTPGKHVYQVKDPAGPVSNKVTVTVT